MESTTLSRRAFLRRLGGAAGAIGLLACTTPGSQTAAQPTSAPAKPAESPKPAAPVASPAASPAAAASPAGSPAAASPSPVAGASPSPAAQAPAQAASKTSVSEIKIGQVWPLSGSLAPDGGRIKNGVTYAVDDVNSQGGIKSLGGARITLLDGDSQGRPEVAVSETERLIRDGAVAVFGAYTSAMTIASTQASERAQVPHLVPLGVTDEITERGFKYTFRLVNNATQGGANTGTFVKALIDGQSQKPSSFAIMHENTAFGSSLAPKLVDAMKALGMNQVELIPYAPTATDLSTEVIRVKAAKPDLFLTIGYFNDGLLLARTLKEQRFDALATIGVLHGGLATPQFIQQLGKDADYYFASGSGFDVNDPRTRALQDAYRAKFSAELDNLSIQSWEMANVLGDALERAASIDKEKIREALASTNLQNVVSPLFPDKVVRFDDKGQSINTNFLMFQTQNGANVNIQPEKYANGKAIWPTPPWSQRG